MEKWISQIEDALIIAPSTEHPFFLWLHERYPSLSFKLITKEEVLNSYYGKLKKEALLKYLSWHPELSLSLAKLYIDEAMMIKKDDINPQVHHLWQVKEELQKNHLIEVKKYFSYYLHHQKIVLYGYDYDQELQGLFLDEKIVYRYLDFNYQPRSLSVNVYQNIDDEIADVLQKIIALHQSGVSLNKIFLYVRQEVYYYPLIKLAKDFAIPIENPFQESLLLLKESQDLLRLFEKEGTLGAIENASEVALFLNDIYQKYNSNAFSNERWGEIFTYFLNQQKLPISHYEEELTFTQRSLFSDDEYVFVLGFEQNSFPLIHQDNSYLSDAIKAKIGQTTSKLMNKREQKMVETLLFANQNVFLSYKKEALDGIHQPSILIKSWNLLEVPFSHRLDCYSLQYAQKRWGQLRDYERKYGTFLSETTAYKDMEKPDYLTYDSSFTKSHHFAIDQNIIHSYTALSTYAQCPYKYYLSYVLKLDSFKENFYSKLGTLAHQILEHNYDDNPDYDALFALVKSEQEWTDQEAMLLQNLKDDIQKLFEFNRQHFSQMQNPHCYLEQEFCVSLIDEHPLYLKGFIDKLVLTGPHHEYVTIVDYKTGKDAFDPRLLEYGYSTQLPIYGLLLKNDLRFQDKKIIGAYIQHVLPERVLAGSCQALKKVERSFLLQGITTDNISQLATFDPTYEQSCYIRNMKITSNGFSKNSQLFSEAIWEQYLATTEAFIKKTDDAIRHNLFPISPKQIGDKRACQNCSFKDICFVKEENVILISLKKEDDSDAEMD